MWTVKVKIDLHDFNLFKKKQGRSYFDLRSLQLEHQAGEITPEACQCHPNVFVATCPIAEECPVSKNAQTNQYFGNFWPF